MENIGDQYAAAAAEVHEHSGVGAGDGDLVRVEDTSVRLHHDGGARGAGAACGWDDIRRREARRTVVVGSCEGAGDVEVLS